jgi:hypothetical protein
MPGASLPLPSPPPRRLRSSPLLSSGASTPLRSSHSCSSTRPAGLTDGRRSPPPLPRRPNSDGCCLLPTAPVPSPNAVKVRGSEEVRWWQVGARVVGRVSAGHCPTHRNGNRRRHRHHCQVSTGTLDLHQSTTSSSSSAILDGGQESSAEHHRKLQPTRGCAMASLGTAV